MAKKSKTPSFEESFTRLDEIVRQLEGGKLPLEENLQLFEEGITLSEGCRKELEQAEAKIQSLVKKSGGSYDLEEMD